MKDLKRFLQDNYPNAQAFNTRNFVGDEMRRVYDNGQIIVDYCDFYDYVEIFGITPEEFESLLDKEKLPFMSFLRTFTEDEM